MFLLATLENGTKLVSEFSKLGKVEKYANQVFTGYKPFNAWRVTGTVNPANGEKALIRTRDMINGKLIVSLAEVEPTTEDHNLDPANFRPVAHMQKGTFGTFKVPAENTPEGLTAGAEYQIHMDEASRRKYVVARAAIEGADPTTAEGQEVRHYLDADRTSFHVDSVDPEYDDYEDPDDDF